MMKTGHIFYTTITRVDFDSIELMPNVHVFRYCALRTTADHPDIENTNVEVQGVTDDAGIIRLNTGLVPTSKNVFFFCDETIEHIRRFGMFSDYPGEDARKVFDFIATGGSSDNLVVLNPNDSSFWNIDGTLIPTAIQFDYICARMHDGAYDLVKALVILLARDDVTFYNDEKKIQDIPYYNRDDDRDQYLQFWWIPSQEQAEAIHAEKSSMESYKLIFDRDMLGLRAAARYDDFYKG